MVDPGADVLELAGGEPEVSFELACGALHRMTEADRGDRAGTRDRPAEHGHRIHVLEEQCLGTEFLHVAAEVEDDGNRPQPAHDSSDPDCVADRLAQPELLRYFEVRHRRWAVAADLHHREDVVGAVQHGAAIAAGFDANIRSCRRGDLLCDELRGPKPVFVDVHQRDRHVAGELRIADQVTDQRLREDGRAGTDECDLH